MTDAGDEAQALRLRETWLLAEFETLRTEIERAKDREYKVLIAGFGLVPAVASLMFKFAPPPTVDAAAGPAQSTSATDAHLIVVATLPLLVTALTMVFLTVNRSAHRCGEYIRDQIEPFFCSKNSRGEDELGWETWLDTGRRNRAPERLLRASFAVLALIYYAASAALAVCRIRDVGDASSRTWIGACVGYAVVAVLTAVAAYVASRDDARTEGRDAAS